MWDSMLGNFDGLGKISSTAKIREKATNRCLAIRMSSPSGILSHFILCLSILLIVLRSTPYCAAMSSCLAAGLSLWNSHMALRSKLKSRCLRCLGLATSMGGGNVAKVCAFDVAETDEVVVIVLSAGDADRGCE